MTSSTKLDPYDLVPYPAGSHPQTHPAALGAIALLFGVAPAREHWRVLELGCGRGDNLIGIAYTARDGEYTGIDLAADPIRQGNALIGRLGLDNVRLLRQDVLELPLDGEPFDYIIAHGLYSWVPGPVREHILALCGARLAPQGVAYVSYNANPGSHLRAMLREMMLRFTRSVSEPHERITRAHHLLQVLAETDPRDESDRFRQMVRAEANRLARFGPALLFHDELAPVNDACYFSDFIASAAVHGLRFLAEADLPSMNDDVLPSPMRALLDETGDDYIEREQVRDFLECRRFRQTLLVRSHVQRAADPITERLSELWVTAAVRTQATPVELTGPDDVTFSSRKDSKFTLDHAFTKVALATLGAAYPRSLSLSALVNGTRDILSASGGEVPSEPAVDTLRRFLLWGMYAGMVEASTRETAFVAIPSVRPRASKLARLQVHLGAYVTGLTHRPVRIEDEITRHLLTLLDGTRDRDELMRALGEFAARGTLPPEAANAFLGQDRAKCERSLERTLRAIAGLALLEE